MLFIFTGFAYTPTSDPQLPKQDGHQPPNTNIVYQHEMFEIPRQYCGLAEITRRKSYWKFYSKLLIANLDNPKAQELYSFH